VYFKNFFFIFCAQNCTFTVQVFHENLYSVTSVPRVTETPTTTALGSLKKDAMFIISLYANSDAYSNRFLRNVSNHVPSYPRSQ